MFSSKRMRFFSIWILLVFSLNMSPWLTTFASAASVGDISIKVCNKNNDPNDKLIYYIVELTNNSGSNLDLWNFNFEYCFTYDLAHPFEVKSKHTDSSGVEIGSITAEYANYEGYLETDVYTDTYWDKSVKLSPGAKYYASLKIETSSDSYSFDETNDYSYYPYTDGMTFVSAPKFLLYEFLGKNNYGLIWGVAPPSLSSITNTPIPPTPTITPIPPTPNPLTPTPIPPTSTPIPSSPTNTPKPAPTYSASIIVEKPYTFPYTSVSENTGMVVAAKPVLTDLAVNQPFEVNYKISGKPMIMGTASQSRQTAIIVDNSKLSSSQTDTSLSAFDYNLFSGNTSRNMSIGADRLSVDGKVHSNKEIVIGCVEMETQSISAKNNIAVGVVPSYFNGTSGVAGVSASTITDTISNTVRLSTFRSRDNSPTIAPNVYTTNVVKDFRNIEMPDLSLIQANVSTMGRIVDPALVAANGNSFDGNQTTFDVLTQTFTVSRNNADYSGDAIFSGNLLFGFSPIQTIEGNCLIGATDNITINADKLSTQSEELMLYSINGNITLNVDSIDEFKGIIYAPNGTITLNCNDAVILGRVIANNIVFSGGRFAVEGYSTKFDTLPNALGVSTSANSMDIIESQVVSFIESFKGQNTRIGIIVTNSNSSAPEEKFFNMSIPSEYDELINAVRKIKANTTDSVPILNMGDALRRAYNLIKSEAYLHSTVSSIVTIGTSIPTTWSTNSSTLTDFHLGTGISPNVGGDGQTDYSGLSHRYAGIVCRNMIRTAGIETYFVSLSNLAHKFDTIDESYEYLGTQSGSSLASAGLHFFKSTNENELIGNLQKVTTKILGTFYATEVEIKVLLPVNATCLDNGSHIKKVMVSGREECTFKLKNVPIKQNSAGYYLDSQLLKAKFRLNAEGTFTFDRGDCIVRITTTYNNGAGDISEIRQYNSPSNFTINVTKDAFFLSVTQSPLKYEDVRVGDVNSLAIKLSGNNFTQNVAPIQKNVALILDTSGSMTDKISASESSTKIAALKDATKSFLLKLKDRSDINIGILPFSSTAKGSITFEPILTNYDSLVSTVDSLNSSSMTNYEDPLSVAYDAFIDPSKAPLPCNNYLFFMSDGYPNTYNSGSSTKSDSDQTAIDKASIVAAKIKSEGIKSAIIGFVANDSYDSSDYDENPLLTLGNSMGSIKAPTTKPYFIAKDNATFNAMFDSVFADTLITDTTMGPATFEHTMPSDVQVLPLVELTQINPTTSLPEILPATFTITKDPITGITKITGTLEGLKFRYDPILSTFSLNEVSVNMQFKTVNYSISTEAFIPPTKITYADRFSASTLISSPQGVIHMAPIKYINLASNQTLTYPAITYVGDNLTINGEINATSFDNVGMPVPTDMEMTFSQLLPEGIKPITAVGAFSSPPVFTPEGSRYRVDFSYKKTVIPESIKEHKIDKFNYTIDAVFEKKGNILFDAADTVLLYVEPFDSTIKNGDVYVDNTPFYVNPIVAQVSISGSTTFEIGIKADYSAQVVFTPREPAAIVWNIAFTSTDPNLTIIKTEGTHGEKVTVFPRAAGTYYLQATIVTAASIDIIPGLIEIIVTSTPNVE